MPRKFVLKRIFDIIISSLLLVMFFPLFVIIAVLIKIDSKGEAIFKQMRLGKDGNSFLMYKFRSMVVNAEQMEAGLFYYKGDTRVTRIGKILRKTSLDELPQLLNVFKGDMSIIGPRPSVTYELGDYDTLNARYKKRFTIKPGITGYAQISGRNELHWDEKVNYDNRYIDLFDKYGVFWDFYILIKTIHYLFKAKDIYENKKDESLDDKLSTDEAAKKIIEMAHRQED